MLNYKTPTEQVHNKCIFFNFQNNILNVILERKIIHLILGFAGYTKYLKNKLKQ